MAISSVGRVLRMKAHRRWFYVSVLVFVVSGGALEESSMAGEAGWKAGFAKANITPEEPLWLAGYASRTNPAVGKVMDLWIKVLALEDSSGHRAVILTSDTLGIPQSIYQHTTAALKEKFGLEPADILLTASHTHCGPVLRGALYDAYPLDDHQRELIESYSSALEPKIVETVGKALTELTPVRVASGQGITRFAVNRRNNKEGQVPALIQEGALKGPVDYSVPVLAVFARDGALKGVLFGYACHNTVMSFNKWSGDYAGFAQLALEKHHPGAAAMFFMGCGGDQNPMPRGQLELAERYGNMLASAVEEVLVAPGAPAGVSTNSAEDVARAETVSGVSALRTLAPGLRTSFESLTLDLGPAPTEAELQAMQSETNTPSAKRYASRLRNQLKQGKPFMRTYPYPMQAWRLGDAQLLVTLGGEPVVDYSLKFKAEFSAKTWVAGYCNDVMTYIPSLRVLKEGGYEGGKAMIPYGLPAARWGDDVEDLITAAARRLVAQVALSNERGATK